MKIVFITPRLSYSGAPKIVSWIANGMVKRGHDVTITIAYKSRCEQSLDKRVKTIFLDIQQSKNWIYRNTIGMLKAVSGCRKKIKDIKPDVIISFLDTIGYIYVWLNHYFWKDTIITSERADPYSRSQIKIKTILSIMKKSALVVFQTKEAKSFYKKKCQALKDCVIPNPVVSNSCVRDAISKRKRIDFSKREKLEIASVGRLSLKQKRQDILLRAMAELKHRGIDFELEIFGSGPDEKKINALINEYSLEDYVKMMGQQDNIPLKICASDCFILTSDFEGIPNALAEAMSIGIPCISTDCSPGGAKLLINNGKNGFLVNKGDYESIADKVVWIKEHKKESLAIGDNAAMVVVDYSEEKVIEAWEKEIKGAVGKRYGK